MLSKNLLMLLLPLLVALPAEAEARGPNDQFTFAGECQVEAANLGKTPHANQDEKNLSEDLGLLNNMVTVVNDSKEDSDFRHSVMGNAETIRQSIFYSLKNIAKSDKAKAKRFMKICGLEKIQKKLHWSEKTLEDIILNLDGVDEENISEQNVKSNPAVIEGRDFAQKKEFVPEVPKDVHHELNAVDVQ